MSARHTAVNDEDGGPAERPAPAAFVRGITAAPVAPWDQTRAANLEARLNAPLPLEEVAYVLRRLEPWRPGTPGRFAAVYVRRRDIGDGLTVQPELNGKPVTAQFVSPIHQRAQVRRLGLVAGAAALGGFLLITVAVSLWTARVQSTERLASLEQLVADRTREANQRARAAAQVRALDALGMRGRQAAVVLDDLAWAGQARNPAASVEAFHWEGGFMAVEVRGDAPPFAVADRQAHRSRAPLRRGVWLWGVEPTAPTATQTAQ